MQPNEIEVLTALKAYAQDLIFTKNNQNNIYAGNFTSLEIKCSYTTKMHVRVEL